MKRILIASVVAVVVLVAQARAQTGIVFYSFNDTSSTGAVITATVGSGLSTFSNFNSAGNPISILSSVSGNPNNRGFSAGNSVSQNGWDGDASYFQFTLDSTGYQDIILSWGENRSSTGPNEWTIRYSSNGGGLFTDFSTIALPANSAVSVDLTSVTAINNNPDVIFRLVGIGASAAGGTAKIDNFNIDATAVIPEPSTVVLVGAGLVGLLALRRRRS
jgi:hypothetical protein